MNLRYYPASLLLLFSLVLAAPALGQDIKSLTDKGIEECNAGKFDQAISTFTQALKQKPDSTLYVLRGKTYTAKNQYAQALQDFEQALKLNPGNGQAYFGRAMVYVYQENFDQALENLEKAKNLGVKDEDFYKYVKKLSEGKRKK
jgi:Tfp pilus assembly protein PilF